MISLLFKVEIHILNGIEKVEVLREATALNYACGACEYMDPLISTTLSSVFID